jgi:hypothetical protein
MHWQNLRQRNVIEGEHMHAGQFRGFMAIAILALAMACTRSGRVKPGMTAFDEIATARITNNAWLDVNVYASRSGSRQRLGTVTGQNTEVFELPRSFVEARGVSIVIDAIGSPQTYQTDVIPAGPGQQIDVVVQQRLAMSHYSVLSP